MTSRKRSHGARTSFAIASTVIATSLLVATPAHAWEPTTTQAGLAEQAALSSRLHRRLVNLGFIGGLFEPLTIPPKDAPPLIQALKLLPPTHGSVPDSRGRQVALAWLAAGAALADVPAKHGANHFFDPLTGKGWQRPDRATLASFSDRVRENLGRDSLPAQGVAAPDWIFSKDNPFNVSSFLAQYGKAVTATTPGERSRHMAAALVAAGAILHVLGDLGAPSRVRNDLAAHLDPLGGGPDDLGSRTERIAALAYGRLGVPAPDKPIVRAHIRDFFTAADGLGLADVTARNYFSANTLPRPSRINEEQPVLVRPKPELPARLNLMAASRDDGTTLRDRTGICLARYRVEHGVLAFNLDDDCILEQLAIMLPRVGAYETGLLDFLFRGDLTISTDAGIVVSGAELGAGRLDILVEDDRGIRSNLASTQVTGGKAETVLGQATVPPTGSRIIAIFRGADSGGEPIVAIGAMPLTH